MKRIIFQELLAWKNASRHKPLLLRGARQIGKTFIAETLGAEFSSCVTINFELQPDFKKHFDSLDPFQILKRLSLFAGHITPGKTLLFLDEIQECPQAITALRYFYEKLPDLHVLGAGSLLEFALEAENFSMPVGRVESLFMQPFSFEEFLAALGFTKLCDYLGELTLAGGMDTALHGQMLALLKDYLIVGGLPEAIREFCDDRSQNKYHRSHLALLQGYRGDFGKYATKARFACLEKMFAAVPGLVGQRFKYSHVDRDVPSRDFKVALTLLEKAGVVKKVHAVSGHGLPFLKDAEERKFKMIFLDVGLMQCACGLEPQIVLAEDIMQTNMGAVTEQFVGQNLLTLGDPYADAGLYFWAKDVKQSQAEVDYLIEVDGVIYPVEVKSGKTGWLKSLKRFLKEHPKSPFGIRLSGHELSYHDHVLSIPLYAVNQLKRLVREAVKNS